MATMVAGTGQKFLSVTAGSILMALGGAGVAGFLAAFIIPWIRRGGMRGMPLGEIVAIVVVLGIILSPFWLMGICGYYLLTSVFWSRERVIMAGATMTVIRHNFWAKTQQHDIHHLLKLPDWSQQWTQVFNQLYGEVKHLRGIPYTEARRLVDTLTDMIAFRCHTAQRIVFGEPSAPDVDPLLTLHNPDVSTLTMPFFHLKQIDIDADTHDFQQVERFLTYAVNVIGQAYLKKCVEVRIYGDAEHLHPNLRQNFEYLCRHVTVHDADNNTNPSSHFWEQKRGGQA